jgi:hypothetical protein
LQTVDQHPLLFVLLLGHRLGIRLLNGLQVRRGDLRVCEAFDRSTALANTVHG